MLQIEINGIKHQIPYTDGEYLLGTAKVVVESSEVIIIHDDGTEEGYEVFTDADFEEDDLYPVNFEEDE